MKEAYIKAASARKAAEAAEAAATAAVKAPAALEGSAGDGQRGDAYPKGSVGEQAPQQQERHYMTQPLVELYGGCMVVLKVL